MNLAPFVHIASALARAEGVLVFRAIFRLMPTPHPSTAAKIGFFAHIPHVPRRLLRSTNPNHASRSHLHWYRPGRSPAFQLLLGGEMMIRRNQRCLKFGRRFACERGAAFCASSATFPTVPAAYLWCLAAAPHTHAMVPCCGPAYPRAYPPPHQ